MRGQFECGVTCFCFDLVCSNGLCCCRFIVCLRVQVVKIKQADGKMSTKNMNSYKFRDIS